MGKKQQGNCEVKLDSAMNSECCRIRRNEEIIPSAAS